MVSGEHVWIKKDEKNSKVLIIGLNKESVKKVDEFVFIGLPEKNSTIKKDQDLFSLEAMKWSGSIKSPVSGKILEINMAAYNEPSLINKEPEKTWLVKILSD